jgi:hypothetical protein
MKSEDVQTDELLQSIEYQLLKFENTPDAV